MSPSLSELWQSRTVGCQIVSANCAERVSSRGAALQASIAKRCMPPKALSTVEVRRRPSAAQVQREAATDERVGLFTPDKDGDTHTSCGRVAAVSYTHLTLPTN